MNSETLKSQTKSSPSNSKLLHTSPILQSSPHPPSNFDHHNPFQPMLFSKSSKWLRRLRSSRGFPSDNIDFEQFLSNSIDKIDPQEKIDPQTCTDSAKVDRKSQLDKRADGEAIQEPETINNVLSELFHMGEFQNLSKINKKKSCRKQQCPRICVVSTSPDVQNVAARKDRVSLPAPSPLPLTLSNRRKAKEANQESKVTNRVEEEEEKCQWDLSAYSQTEVTVIDTSVPSWKFDKMLYRRKNVWKVGDKKGKGSMSSDRKKRKEKLSENGEVQRKKSKLCSSSSKSENAQQGEEKKKKKKKKKKKLQLCDSLKHTDKQEAMVRSKSTQGHEQGKTMAASHEKKQDSSSQVQEKSSLKKQVDGGSSVVLIKSIPTTNKKDISGSTKSSLKYSQK